MLYSEIHSQKSNSNRAHVNDFLTGVPTGKIKGPHFQAGVLPVS